MQSPLHCFFFNDTATTEIYTLSLHDALPICRRHQSGSRRRGDRGPLSPGSLSSSRPVSTSRASAAGAEAREVRSEEHTSELQSPDHLVCRLLLEKKKNNSCRSVITASPCHST